MAGAGVHELVGREQELAAVDRFLKGVPEASGVAVVEGEAGMGKTTLWVAGVDRARERGFRVLVARPAEAEGALAFTALSDLLAGVHSEVAKLPDPQRRPLAAALLLEETRGVVVEPNAIAIGFLALLRSLARDGPVLVAIDDIQWVDPASALAVSFALRRGADDPIGGLLARRTGRDTNEESGLGRGLDGNRIELDPLSLGAFRRVLEDRLAHAFPRPVLRRIHAQAGGNPFFGLELGRALQARGEPVSMHDDLPVPRDLERLIAARLEGLPSELKEPLAAVAALADPRRDLIGDDVLDPALAAGVLLLDGERVRFEHPLVAAAAYGRLTPRQRRTLHQRLAGLVEDFGERARHLALAAEGPDPSLAVLLDEAALQARSRGAPQAAADLAGLALRATEPGDRHGRVLRCVAAAEHSAVAGDHAAARALVDDALADEPSGPDRARLLLQRAQLGDEAVDTAIARMEEALANARGDAALEAEILAVLTHLITNSRRTADAEPYARRCLELAERTGDVVLLVRAITVLAINQFFLGRGFPDELMRRALELDPLCESMRISMRPITIAGWMSIWTGDLDRARALLDRALRIGRERADSTVHAVLWAAAALEHLADDWSRSAERTDELHQLGVEAEYEPVVISALCARAVLSAHFGDEESTRSLAAEAIARDERRGSRNAVRLGGWALGVLELSLDEPAAALRHLRQATAEPRAEGLREPGLLPSFPLHVEAAIATGEQAEAEELLTWAEENASRLDRPWASACCARSRGLLATALGDEAGATAAFDRALAEHTRVQGHRFDLARTLLAQGETLRRFKKKRPAREAIGSAVAIFDELGAVLWRAKAERELARVSGRTRAEGLTETESRVATLVAAGRSNKEVAHDLFVTVRTVETHLTKIYAKLDVRSRTELARRLQA